MIKKGMEVPEDYSMKYYDNGILSNATNITTTITNYEYEEKIQNSRRNIFVLKGYYLTLTLNNLEKIMPYKPGSSQYVSKNLVKGDNIRLYS
jgi:hypothetical protein